ncbi:DUF4255 domain-containing protein [Sphingomonas parva]|uniref:DUF4255 domain-containing protein n=1 Tax=Sphingomonas parva TaxID=2555898 RepID=A0A4Y8ZLP2_9SPHN|nr:DUF4255 domain-containing protein [Sphingomonas parva]TFI56928.1 DUF4255 domain-containing protein [Sphingomonas parva]
MSNHLAIATVTAALGQIAQAAAASAVSGVQLRFGRPPATDTATRQVNVFLYHLMPHAGLRNADLAMRGADGALVNRPRAALSLHYLISFYGTDSDLEPDRMAAAVARDLHARPRLTDQVIADAIASNSAILGESDLADSFERVTFTPSADSLDEMSRLWSVMVQTPYALSLRYEASVVLIDALESAGPVLPVLNRGPDDRGPETLAAVGPTIEGLWIGLAATDDGPPRFPSLRAAHPGAKLRFSGSGFGGDSVRLEFRNLRRDIGEDLVPVASGSGELRATLPDGAPDQALWAPGIYGVTAVVTRAGREIRSPAWPMPLAVRVTAIAPQPLASGSGMVTLNFTCRPHVLPEQIAILLLSGQEIPAEDRVAAGPTLAFRVDSDSVADGDLAIVRVDGADSQPFVIDSVTGRLTFDDSQRITVA